MLSFECCTERTISTHHILITQREHFISLLKSPSSCLDGRCVESLSWQSWSPFSSETLSTENWTSICFYFADVCAYGLRRRRIEVIEDIGEVQYSICMDGWGLSCWDPSMGPSFSIWTVFISLKGQNTEVRLSLVWQQKYAVICAL